MFRTLTTAALIALTVTAAQAGEKVRFGDLNLASQVDVQTLKARIHDAAVDACLPARLDFGVSAATAYQAEQEHKACVARVAEATLTKIQTLASAATAPTTRVASN